jgi:TPR repeat protein
MNMLGRCYENGWGVRVDMKLAAVWYRRSADTGYDWGQYNLAHLYLDGNGVPQNVVLAFEYYLKAAQQGHSRAMNLVACCLEEGWGTKPDRAAATAWYQKSAEAGYFRAQFNYATALLERGDVDAAVGWFERAAKDATPDLRQHIERRLAAIRDRLALSTEACSSQS